MVDGMARSRQMALVGGIVWLAWGLGVGMSSIEASWATALLLLAALVLVPLGLGLALDDAQPSSGDGIGRMAMRLQLPAACALSVSCLFPMGMWAAILALPWLAFTGLVAWLGVYRLWCRGLAPLPEWCLNVGLIYLVVGGGWTLLSRFDARPLGFASVIVLLTAVHFHYAGFVLPLLTGLAARKTSGFMADIATIGVIVGVPLVAVGITATQRGFGMGMESVAASLTALAGLLTAGLQFRLSMRPGCSASARLLWALSAIALVAGMALAALYGLRAYWPLPWLSIPWMQAVHGSVNALGFGFTGVVAWHLANGRYGDRQPPAARMARSERIT